MSYSEDEIAWKNGDTLYLPVRKIYASALYSTDDFKKLTNEER